MATEQQIWNALANLWRQYPRWPSTFGPCSRGCVDMMGRGSGPCAQCYERDLANLVGLFPASEYHRHIREFRRLESEMIQGSSD